MRATTERTDNHIEWFAYETKAASLNQERRSEELQLEKLKLRLQRKMQEAVQRDHELTAA